VPQCRGHGSAQLRLRLRLIPGRPRHGHCFLITLKWVFFPPCLVRPGRRLPVQGLSEGSLGHGYLDRLPA